MGKNIFNFALGAVLSFLLIGAFMAAVYYIVAFWIWVSNGAVWGLLGTIVTIASVALGFLFAKDEAQK